MTRKELLAVPWRDNWSDPIVCKSLVLLACHTKHESGFAHIDAVAVDAYGEPICRVAGASDVIHVGGINGQNKQRGLYGIPWSIDCLYKSKLFHLFVPGSSIQVGASVSSLEIRAIEQRQNGEQP